jgi:Tfp pilus assembly protein PilV
MGRERTMERGARRAGTSLIEVLVALALALVLVVGAAEMMTSALRAKRRGDVAAALIHAVTDRLESLKSRPFDDAALDPGDHEEVVRVEPGGCLVAETWEITDDGNGQKRVRLRAREAGRDGPETVATLFISRDLGFRP